MNYRLKSFVFLIVASGLVACVNAPPPAQKPVAKAVVAPPVQPKEPEVVVDVNAPLAETLPLLEPAHMLETEVTDKASNTAEKRYVYGKIVLGSEEWVYLPGVKESFKARIDTEATSSTISAVDLVPFERGGQDWVKFRIKQDGVPSGEMSVPVERWLLVRQAGSEQPLRLPIIMTWIQIGDAKEQTEFTLVDRSQSSYPVMLGRSYVRDAAIVDLSREYVQPKHPSAKP